MGIKLNEVEAQRDVLKVAADAQLAAATAVTAALAAAPVTKAAAGSASQAPPARAQGLSTSPHAKKLALEMDAMGWKMERQMLIKTIADLEKELEEVSHLFTHPLFPVSHPEKRS